MEEEDNCSKRIAMCIRIFNSVGLKIGMIETKKAKFPVIVDSMLFIFFSNIHITINLTLYSNVQVAVKVTNYF